MSPTVERRLRALVVALATCALPAIARAGSDPPPVVRYALAAWSTEQSGDVLAVAQDVEGYLWLATNDGPVRFDGSRFEPWAKRTNSTPLARPAVALAASAQGGVWVGFGGAGGVARIHRSG